MKFAGGKLLRMASKTARLAAVVQLAARQYSGAEMMYVLQSSRFEGQDKSKAGRDSSFHRAGSCDWVKRGVGVEGRWTGRLEGAKSGSRS